MLIRHLASTTLTEVRTNPGLDSIVSIINRTKLGIVITKQKFGSLLKPTTC